MERQSDASSEASGISTGLLRAQVTATAGEGKPAKQQGRAGKIILAGFDDLPDTLAGIRDGTVNFCIAQRTYKMGWLSVENLRDTLDGKPLPKEIDTGVLIITKDNVDTYMQDMKKEFAK